MNNIIWKILLYFVITLIITIILALLQQKINLDFKIVVLPQLAPAIGFLIIILIFKNLIISLNFDFNMLIALKISAAFITPLLLFSVVFILCRILGLEINITSGFQNILIYMIGGIILGAIGEEIGWRSFLQPTLEKSYSVIISSIIVGMIWGLWHIGHYKNGFLFMAGFLLFTLSASIIIAWILRGTNFNLLISVMFHISINIGFLLFFFNSLTNSKIMIINGIIWFIPAAIIFLINRVEWMKI